MYIDPGMEMQASWTREILQKNKPLAMWGFFTNASLLDEETIESLMANQKHIIRMHFYFALMSVLPISLGICRPYVVVINNEDYFLRNLECIKSVNTSLTCEREGDDIHVQPLNMIFRVGEFCDRNTYRIPFCLGGSPYAYEIFSSYDDYDE